MKYWNKDKRVRQEHWTGIQRTNYRGYLDIKRELQLLPSDGKFYMYFGSRTVWFEREEDAVFVALRGVV
jgi:hypothetical protein